MVKAEGGKRPAIWDLKSSGTVLHSQALADRVVIDIPVKSASVQLLSAGFDGRSMKPFPELEPLYEGDIVEISITNLPLMRPMSPPDISEHFGWFCKLALDPNECDAVMPEVRPMDGPISGSGVICPMLTFEPR